MSAFLVLLFFISLGLLTWGLIAPVSLARYANKGTKKELTRKHFAVLFGLASFILLVLVGATAPSNAQQGKVAVENPPAQSQPKITKKIATETKPVPFASTTVNDASLAKGDTKITTAGVDGVETLTYTVIYTNGVQASKTLASDKVTTQPVAQVTSVGTYVALAAPTGCTNGTYVNSVGNTVCSPESAPSAPPVERLRGPLDGL